MSVLTARFLLVRFLVATKSYNKMHCSCPLKHLVERTTKQARGRQTHWLPSVASLDVKGKVVFLRLENDGTMCRFVGVHLHTGMHNVARSGMAGIPVTRPRKLPHHRVQRALEVFVLGVQIQETPDHFRGAPQRRRRVR